MLKIDRIKKVMIMLVVLLFISGCKGNGVTKFFKKGSDFNPATTSADLYKGSNGLTMSFLEKTPSAEIFEGGVLFIGAKLANEGAYDIDNGFLLLNLERDYMQLEQDSLRSLTDEVSFIDDNHMRFNVNGKSIEYPDGDYDVITFAADALPLSRLDPSSESYEAVVSLTSCYEYQTRAIETVCIDSDVYEFKKREKACKVEDKSLSSQGAPIAVTKIESEMLPTRENTAIVKPIFIITINNVGGGKAVKKRNIRDACFAGTTEWDFIDIRAYLSTIEEANRLDCNIDEIKLEEGTGTVICTYEKGFSDDVGAFSSPLYIILDYGYTDTVFEKVKIKRIFR